MSGTLMAQQTARTRPTPSRSLPRSRATEEVDPNDLQLLPPELKHPVSPEQLRASLAAALESYESGRDRGTPAADVLAEMDEIIARRS